MNGRSKPIYEFGEYVLIPAERLLLKDGSPVQLPQKAFDVLVVLVENAGELVDNKQMLEKVWPDSFVEEANIQVQMSSIRKALSENGKRLYIETIPKNGYRFTNEVRTINGSQSHSKAVENELDEIPVVVADASAATLVSSRRKSIAVVVFIAAIAAVGIGFIVFRQLLRRSPPPFEKVSISKITTTGKEMMSAISPDGTNLVYQHSENGKNSLWLRNIPSGAEKQLLEPGVFDLESLVFSPSGDSIYFGKSERNEPASVFKLSIRDGIPIKVIDRINSRVTFSPDANQVAFIRVNSEQSSWDVIIASTSGKEERTIVISQPGELIRYPAWSPISRKLAAFKLNLDADDVGNRYSLVEIDADSGEITPISQERWQTFGDIAWLNDGSGIVFTASKQIAAPDQVWHLDRRTGTAKKLTNDTDNYSAVTLDRNSDLIAAAITTPSSGVWISHDKKDPGTVVPIANGATTQEGDWGVAFGSGNKILYTTRTDGKRNIWSMNPNGTERIRLTNGFWDGSPTVVPNTGDIIYYSQVVGEPHHLWKMAADGTGKTQLTKQLESYPVVTHDGKWLIFTGGDDVKRDIKTIWKVPIAGGDRVQISDKPVRSQLAVSPDGKLLAFATYDDEEGSKLKIMLLSVDTGAQVKLLDTPPGFVPNFRLRWSPDGSAITYVASFGPSWNLWNLPLDGSPPKQLTHFDNESTRDFDWSLDGRLIVAKRKDTNDVVLIRQQN